jgi:hypothetical protein
LIAAGGLTLVIGVAFIAAYGLKRTGALNVVGAFPGPVGTTAKAVSSGGKSVGQAASAKRAETARQQRRAENTTDAETRAAAKRYASSGSRQVSGVPKSSKPSANRGRNERAKSIPRREGYDSVPF